jgi:ComF family protein
MGNFKEICLDWGDAFLNLLFPNLCIGCYEKVVKKKVEFCISCEYKIPKTELHLTLQNDFTAKFSPRIPIHAGAGCYFFTKKGHTQKLIHQIKYHGKKEAATKIGEYYGKILAQSPHFHGIDYIIPVPMFINKERIRGYNQADYFAYGLSTSMGIDVLKRALKKIKNTTSQTQHGKMGRWENVEEVFQLGDENLENRHILLVDDVLTTGATMEACARELLKVPNIKISMATIAFAGRY